MNAIFRSQSIARVQMMKTLISVISVVFMAACAETPEWTPGLVVEDMTQLQVANQDVIENPVEGVAAPLDAEKALSAIKPYRAPVEAEAGKSRDIIISSGRK